jgi:hypothetical protein
MGLSTFKRHLKANDDINFYEKELKCVQLEIILSEKMQQEAIVKSCRLNPPEVLNW